MTTFKKATDKDGNTLEIVYDECPQDYIKDQDTYIKVICWHKRHQIGNEHDISNIGCKNWEELEDKVKKETNAKYIRRVFMYEHSGIVLSLAPFSSPWDSGQIGFIMATEEDIKKWYEIEKINNETEIQVFSYFQSFIKEYSKYLNGEVYGYKITDKNGEDLDSCYGFYGLDFDNNGMKYNIENRFHPLLEQLE